MKTKTEEFGYIELSGKVVISDPCYDRDVWCMKTDFPVKPGPYKAQVTYSDEGEFGVRVAAIALVHKEHEQMTLTGWKNIDADIGVDSGQCGIFDNSIYPQAKDHPDNASFYDECCKLTLGKKQAGILKSRRGIVSSSGYGDGSYNLRTICQNDEHVALLLDYDLISMKKIMNRLVSRQKSD